MTPRPSAKYIYSWLTGQGTNFIAKYLSSAAIRRLQGFHKYMVHSVLQGVFITIIAIMIIGLITPAFYTSDKKTDKLFTRFVIPINNANDASLAFTVAHIEKLLQQPHVTPDNITLVATDTGIELYNDKSKYQARLQNLLAKGVQMYVCESTANKTHRQSVKLIDGVKKVVDGKHYIEELMEQGFTNSLA